MKSYKYNIPLIPLIAITLIATSPIFVFSGISLVTLALWLLFTLPFISLALIASVFEITPSGVKLYRINQMQWNEVKDAKVVSLLGLRYLLVKRRQGMDFWIPLYFRGNTLVENAFRENTPSENPIATCF